MEISAIGRTIIVVAVILLVLGVAMLVLGRLTGGRGLPGDIFIRRDGVTIYFPIVTMIVLSIILSLLLTCIFWLIGRGR